MKLYLGILGIMEPIVQLRRAAQESMSFFPNLEYRSGPSEDLIIEHVHATLSSMENSEGKIVLLERIHSITVDMHQKRCTYKRSAILLSPCLC